MMADDIRQNGSEQPAPQPPEKARKEKKKKRRAFRAKGPSKSMKIRANAVILSVIFLASLGLIINLGRIMLVEHTRYTDMANSRQFGTIALPAARGSIYDANGAVLAQSATVYKIFVDPGLFRQELEMIETRNDELLEEAAKNAKDGDGQRPDIVDTQVLTDQVCAYLADMLELSPNTVKAAFETENSNYVVLKKQVEKSKADRVMEYMEKIHVPGSERDITLSSISRESDVKRYYPQNELAASVIGFNNAEGHGIYGVEAYYDSYLSGIDGKTVTAKDANGNEMPYRYSKTYPAQDGDDVYLTIDMTLQTYLENAVSDMVETYQVANRGCGVMLNAKTGAVMAMATAGGFDLNSPYEIADPDVRAEIDLMPDGEEKDKALSEARETQWRNKVVAETYIPGSVFKVFTASSALEEDKISYDDRFYCSGSVEVVPGEPPMHCWRLSGHGSESFEQILINSCNPAFIDIGQRLGKDLFFRYFEAYGLTEKTGIDLYGETGSVYQSLETMGPVELASSSFGQTNSISPIQMVTGYAAVVNGGYLLKPYVVSKVVDSSGNVVLSNEKTVRRQVISAETSAEMRKALQAVVDNNGGSNAYIHGYKIGGKSGTAQKLMGNYNASDYEFIASYCCFAPADDPEIVLLIMADEPNKSIDYYGSSVVAPYSRAILEKVLPYLGYYPEYTEEEQKNLDVMIPLLVDSEVAAAKDELDKLGLQYEIVGDGQFVNQQTPVTGSSVSKDGTVMLYTGAAAVKEYVSVPAVVGKTPAQARKELSDAGLNFVVKGASAERSDVKILQQSVTAGTTVEKWTSIELNVGSADQTG